MERFSKQTGLDNLYTKLVCYSDAHCTHIFKVNSQMLDFKYNYSIENILWMPSVDLLVQVVVEPELDVVEVLGKEGDVDLVMDLVDPTVHLACKA